MHIAPKVIEKNTISETGFFPIDRAYVEKRTTLVLEQQYECDQVLNKLEVLQIDDNDKNLIALDINKMISIITSEDPKLLKLVNTEAKKATKKGKAVSKKDGVKQTMLMLATAEETDPDMIESYTEWVESILEHNFLTKIVIETFKKAINNYSTDKQIRRSIIKTAAINSYKDATWAIKSFEINKNQIKKLAGATDPLKSVQQSIAQVNSNVKF